MACFVNGNKTNFILISISLFSQKIITPGDLASSPTFISVPLLDMMIISGAIIAFVQSRAVLYRVDVKVFLFWVMLSAICWAIAFVAASLIGGQDLPITVESIVAGTVIGIASGIPMILIGVERAELYTQNRLQQR